MPKRNEQRTFWNVTVKDEGAGVYRSRHTTASAIRSEFKKNGKTILAISAVK